MREVTKVKMVRLALFTTSAVVSLFLLWLLVTAILLPLLHS